MRAHHRMDDRLAEFLEILGPRVGVVGIEAVDRLQPVEPAPLVFRQRFIGGAHTGDAGAAAGGRDFDAVQDRRGRRALAVGVVGVPALGRTLAVAVPDHPDIGIALHVVLRIMLPHRRPERARRVEILLRGQRLVAEHQRQMLAQRPRQRLAGRRVDRTAEIDPRDLGAERRMERGYRDVGHGVPRFCCGDSVAGRGTSGEPEPAQPGNCVQPTHRPGGAQRSGGLMGALRPHHADQRRDREAEQGQLWKPAASERIRQVL